MKGIKEDLKSKINNGELTPGEPFKEGQIQHSNITVYGRKIPLLGLRQKLLTKHKHPMHLRTDDQLASFSKTELLDYYTKHSIG